MSTTVEFKFDIGAHVYITDHNDGEAPITQGIILESHEECDEVRVRWCLTQQVCWSSKTFIDTSLEEVVLKTLVWEMEMHEMGEDESMGKILEMLGAYKSLKKKLKYQLEEDTL